MNRSVDSMRRSKRGDILSVQEQPPGQSGTEKTESAIAGNEIDLSERGRSSDGQLVKLDRRLFMQFTVYRQTNVAAVASHLSASNIQAVIYQDINDPQTCGIMTYCLDPSYLIDVFQPAIMKCEAGQIQDEFTMLGRTYSIGYESDLEEVLIRRPCQRVCDPATPWAVYYPVRRHGSFERQPASEQKKMLMEHGGIGHAFGKAGFATDIRLAGHGLNKDDNDFIIGLLGKELFPLSALVQRMRRTRQTAEFIDKMGPFFVGRVVSQPNFDPQGELH